MSDKPGKTDNTVKGNLNQYAGSSLTNALDAVIENALASKVMTAAVVKVGSVAPGGPDGPAGYVDCTPMVNDTDAFGEGVPAPDLSHVPFFRLQCGKAAIVIDPEPGDLGLVVFTKADSSNVQPGADKPVQPASHRTFNEANGFFFGGFSNPAPETYLEVNKKGEGNIKAKGNISIETEKSLTIKAASVSVTGDITTGALTSNGVTVHTHTHTGDSGGTTSGPN
jgi:hypothetical protein